MNARAFIFHSFIQHESEHTICRYETHRVQQQPCYSVILQLPFQRLLHNISVLSRLSYPYAHVHTTRVRGGVLGGGQLSKLTRYKLSAKSRGLYTRNVKVLACGASPPPPPTYGLHELKNFAHVHMSKNLCSSFYNVKFHKHS